MLFICIRARDLDNMCGIRAQAFSKFRGLQSAKAIEAVTKMGYEYTVTPVLEDMENADASVEFKSHIGCAKSVPADCG